MECEFEELEREVQKLEQIEKELNSLDAKDVKDFESDAFKIKSKLKDLDSVDEVETEFSSLKRKIKEKKERERRIREEEERRRKEREREEIKDIIYETGNIIKNAILDATDAEDSLWLSALKILQVDFINFSQEFDAGEILYMDAKARILDLKEQAEVLSKPPFKEEMPEESKPNYYDIFGIKHDATQEQIKALYKKLTLIYHPDRGTHLGVDGEQRFRDIKEAYETLIDPDKRREYDKKIGI